MLNNLFVSIRWMTGRSATSGDIVEVARHRDDAQVAVRIDNEGPGLANTENLSVPFYDREGRSLHAARGYGALGPTFLEPTIRSMAIRQQVGRPSGNDVLAT